MASEAGDLPSSKNSRVDDMIRGGEKGKGVQRRGSSKSKGAKGSGAAGNSSTGTEKGDCEILILHAVSRVRACMRARVNVHAYPCRCIEETSSAKALSERE